MLVLGVAMVVSLVALLLRRPGGGGDGDASAPPDGIGDEGSGQEDRSTSV